MRLPLCIAVLALGAFAAAPAAADDDLTQVGPGQYTMRVVEIHGRVTRPLVSADVARLPVRMTLSAPQASFVDRIGAVLDKDPF